MSAPGIHATLDAAVPISGAPNDYDALLERIGTGRCVLIGEASHGTTSSTSSAPGSPAA